MQELDNQQIDDALKDAVNRRIPLTVSINADGWTNFHSRFLEIRDGHVLIEMPIAQDDKAYQFTPAEKVGVSFKLRHHKYLCNARIAKTDERADKDGQSVAVLSLCFPVHMQRVQRRNFARVVVPPGKIVRMSFWAGGKDHEPVGPSADKPVWSGRVVDISAGGFRASVGATEAPPLQIGQTVGVRISFGSGEESIYSDAHYRHCDAQDDKFSIGFQFVGLTHSNEGKDVLRIIGHKMFEYTRAGRRVG